MTARKRITAIVAALFMLFSLAAAFPTTSSAQTIPEEAERPDIQNQSLQNVKAVSAGAHSVKVSWNPLDGADGYLLYQAKTKNGSYQEIASLTSTSYAKKKLTIGKRYYYRVRAWQDGEAGRTYSLDSSAVSAVPRLKAPASVKLSAGEKKIAVRWKKVKGAKGYRIYRSASKKGKFRRIATVSAKTRRYVSRGLKENKKYYFKVRAYTQIKKKVYTGTISVAVSKRTPNTLQRRVDRVYKAATKKVKSKGKETHLRACYDYMIRHYTYTRRDYVPIGAKGWAASHASRFFRDKTGNCYDWASGMYYLAKECGYSPRIYSGQVHYRNGNTGRHGWVEITIDGASYIFDPEMDWSYTHRVGSHYNGWKRKVGTTEMTYIKP